MPWLTIASARCNALLQGGHSPRREKNSDGPIFFLVRAVMPSRKIGDNGIMGHIDVDRKSLDELGRHCEKSYDHDDRILAGIWNRDPATASRSSRILVPGSG